MTNATTTTALFPLGELFATRGAVLACLAAGVSLTAYLDRHAAGDWAELDAEDQAENRYSVPRRLRVFSRYTLPDGTRIWIITEADRSSTTVLLPSEY